MLRILRVLSLVFMLISMILVSCNQDVGSAFNEAEANRLLSLDGSKSWFLTSRSIDGQVMSVSTNCDENVNLIFANSLSDDSSDSLYIVEKIRYCESTITPDTVLTAYYTLSIDSDDNFLNRILLSDVVGDDISSMTVNQLFIEDLKITYNVEGEEIVDTYEFLYERFITTVEANKILSDYTTKTWSLDTRYEDDVEIELETCTDSKNLVFANSDTDTMYFIEQVTGCEEEIEADTTLIVDYTLLGNEFDEFDGVISLDMGSSGELGVGSLSTSELRLVYISNGVEIIEDYSYP